MLLAMIHHVRLISMLHHEVLCTDHLTFYIYGGQDMRLIHVCTCPGGLWFLKGTLSADVRAQFYRSDCFSAHVQTLYGSIHCFIKEALGLNVNSQNCGYPFLCVVFLTLFHVLIS